MRENIKAAQAKYKKSYDKNANPPDYKVRDSVWLYNPKTEPGLTPKLVARWAGPYYITEKLGSTNYKLRDLSTQKAIRNNVHSDRLKPYYNPALRPTNIPEAFARQQPEPLELEDDDEVTELKRPKDSQPDQNAQNAQQAKEEKKKNLQKETIDQTIAPTDDSKNWELEKVLKGSYFRGCMVYRVRYRNKDDGNSKTEWVYANDLPVEVRKDFHIKYTFSGKRRKAVNSRPNM